MAAAFAMPARVMDFDLAAEIERLRTSEQRKLDPALYERLGSQPHRVTSKEALLFNRELLAQGKALNRNASQGSRLEVGADAVLKLLWPGGPVDGPLWRVPLLDSRHVRLDAIRWAEQSPSSRPRFWAWSSFPHNRLVFFDWGLRADGGQALALRLNWPETEELVSVDSCAPDYYWAISRHAELGLAYATFLRQRRPEHIEVLAESRLDLGSRTQKEELATVRIEKGCEEIYFTGTSGRHRVRYKAHELRRHENSSRAL